MGGWSRERRGQTGGSAVDPVRGHRDQFDIRGRYRDDAVTDRDLDRVIAGRAGGERPGYLAGVGVDADAIRQSRGDRSVRVSPSRSVAPAGNSLRHSSASSLSGWCRSNTGPELTMVRVVDVTGALVSMPSKAVTRSDILSPLSPLPGLERSRFADVSPGRSNTVLDRLVLDRERVSVAVGRVHGRRQRVVGRRVRSGRSSTELTLGGRLRPSAGTEISKIRPSFSVGWESLSTPRSTIQ